MSAWLLAAVLLGPAQAADEVAARTCLQAQVWESYGQGWGVRTMTTTTMTADATRNFVATLYPSTDYRIRACGDQGVQELDIYLYDREGQVVARASERNREPVVELQVEQTGTYYVVVHLRSLQEGQDEGGVALAVTYK